MMTVSMINKELISSAIKLIPNPLSRSPKLTL